jgi:hypothetical protein
LIASLCQTGKGTAHQGMDTFFLDAVWPAFENRSRICDRIKGWDFLANGNLGVKLHVVLGAMAGEEVPRVVNRIY